MQSDRELLERAAKAAGIDLHVWGTKGQENFAAMNLPNHPRWNPLTDDGDAFRLAVRLRLCVGPNFDGDKAVCFGEAGYNITEPWHPDPFAATRRAIVRAAAAMAGDAVAVPDESDLPEDNYYKNQAEAFYGVVKK